MAEREREREREKHTLHTHAHHMQEKEEEVKMVAVGEKEGGGERGKHHTESLLLLLGSRQCNYQKWRRRRQREGRAFCWGERGKLVCVPQTHVHIRA